MNKRKLNAVMQLHGESQQNLADYLKMSLSRLNAKINEYRGAQFRQNEIAAIQEHYGLSAEEVNEIFFASLVSQKIPLTRRKVREGGGKVITIIGMAAIWICAAVCVYVIARWGPRGMLRWYPWYAIAICSLESAVLAGIAQISGTL